MFATNPQAIARAFLTWRETFVTNAKLTITTFHLAKHATVIAKEGRITIVISRLVIATASSM